MIDKFNVRIGSDINQADVNTPGSLPSRQWVMGLWDSLAEDGAWGIPRSGMIFRKRGDKLVLTARIPWVAGMPVTVTELRDQQDREFENLKEHFAAVSIEVVSEVT